MLESVLCGKRHTAEQANTVRVLKVWPTRLPVIPSRLLQTLKLMNGHVAQKKKRQGNDAGRTAFTTKHTYATLTQHMVGFSST